MSRTASVPPNTCPGCGTTRSRAPSARGIGVVGPVRATVEGTGPERCPDCGTARDDPGRLVAAARTAIDHRLVGGLAGPGTPRCGGCGTTLDLPMRATARALTVLADRGMPFTVTVELPLVRCGGCAVDNVPPELADAVERAVLTACGLPAAAERRPGAFSRLRRRVGRRSPERPSRP